MVVVCQIEGHGRIVERLLGCTRSEYNPRRLTMTAHDQSEQITLLLLGWHAGGRPTALGIDHDKRRLSHSGEAKVFLHQRDSRASAGRHRAYAGEAGADAGRQ